MMVFALKLLRQFKYTDFDTITLLFNADEEISSPDSRHLIAKLAPQHDCFLCCESGQEGDGLVSSRKGASRILVKRQRHCVPCGERSGQGCQRPDGMPPAD